MPFNWLYGTVNCGAAHERHLLILYVLSAHNIKILAIILVMVILLSIFIDRLLNCICSG